MRLVGGCLGLSALLHGAALALALYSPRHKPHVPPTVLEVTVVYKKPKPLKLKIAPVLPRLGSDAYRHAQRSLGTTLASEHYLERLHQHIDPNWQYFVRMTRLYAVCTTVLNVDANSLGTVTAIVVAQNSCPDQLKQAAIGALYYANLLPPPKLLLDAKGMLKLEWTFTLRKK